MHMQMVQNSYKKTPFQAKTRQQKPVIHGKLDHSCSTPGKQNLLREHLHQKIINKNAFVQLNKKMWQLMLRDECNVSFTTKTCQNLLVMNVNGKIVKEKKKKSPTAQKIQSEINSKTEHLFEQRSYQCSYIVVLSVGCIIFFGFTVFETPQSLSQCKNM